MVTALRPAPGFSCDPLVASISLLKDDEIESMTVEDLQQIIRLSRGIEASPLVPAFVRESSHALLVRLSKLARDRCHERIAEPTDTLASATWFSA